MCSLLNFLEGHKHGCWAQEIHSGSYELSVIAAESSYGLVLVQIHPKGFFIVDKSGHENGIFVFGKFPAKAEEAAEVFGKHDGIGHHEQRGSLFRSHGLYKGGKGVEGALCVFKKILQTWMRWEAGFFSLIELFGAQRAGDFGHAIFFQFPQKILQKGFSSSESGKGLGSCVRVEPGA